MHTLREQLVQAGYWDADDARDPATDASASTVLLNAMKSRLAESAYISYCVSLESKQFSEVFINLDVLRYRLAFDNDLYISICKAALTLPDFLQQYPECAK